MALHSERNINSEQAQQSSAYKETMAELQRNTGDWQENFGCVCCCMKEGLAETGENSERTESMFIISKGRIPKAASG